jgi:transposase-like protein
MNTFHAESRPSSRSELTAWYDAALDAQKDSGLSVAEYAQEIGLTPTTLYRWRRRLESARSKAPLQEAAGLVRVQVRRDSELPDLRRETLVVRIERGRSIEIPPGFDSAELARVIGVLEAC